MAMGGGGGRGLTNDINVTPMIDVLLVLLIIFMIIVPMSRKALDIQLPDPKPALSSAPDPNQIVLEVLPGYHYKLNTQPLDSSELFARLKKTYEGRPDKILFVKGDPTAKYQEIIYAMDVARGAMQTGVIGIPPKGSL
jgi:biopolymer transport protein TolR